MAVRWSKVWGRSSEQCCPPSCYNFTIGCGDSRNGNVLDGFPLTVQTCGEAMGELGQAIKDRLCAQNVIVSATSTTVYTFNIKLGVRGSDHAVVTLKLANTNCDFPVTCSYTYQKKSGSAQFDELGQVVDYLAAVLR